MSQPSRSFTAPPRAPAASREPPAEGFTLVEVLVVMAIISVLAGIVVASIGVARKFSDAKATAVDIQTLVQAINTYNERFGDYPPSSLSALGVKGNPANEGNEALVLALSAKKKNGPFFEFKEGRLLNTDSDSLSAKDLATLKKNLDPIQTSPALYEYVDLWGSPYVYIHNRDYGKKLTYNNRHGNTVQVTAVKSEKLGAYQAATSFQIWSFGPNGLNENGDGDDIASWK
jgi:prepilin-type N-terminal cleavage/methylation domain-containing protein